MNYCSKFRFVPFNHRHDGRLPLGVLRSVEAATELSERCPTSVQSMGAEKVGIG